ncbi:MAG: restriction endonuclease subunit S [Gammaproteobacteria bacterium AqS3]|nr:restriction endonuclease subunit S [Gammaproteobacteria bacterium AqS3]
MDSEIGRIPKGWKLSFIKELTTLNKSSWRKNNHPNEVNFLNLGNIKQNNILGTDLYQWKDAPSSARRILSINDTIVGTVRPGNKSFGYIQREYLTGSTGFAVLTPKQEIYAIFVYLCVCSDTNIDRLSRLADGTAYPKVDNQSILNTRCILPPDDLFQIFHILLKPLFERIEISHRESSALVKLRNTLLPKLISGELRIPDAETLLEEAGI